MSYFAPYIDASGLHIPTYSDIRDDLIEKFKSIYGQDIYLDIDSQDYQMISAFSLKTYDAMQLLQIIYNNRSPKTAIGSALDGIVKINGIRRKEFGYSTSPVVLTGDSGTVINNGVVTDQNDNKWSLPSTVTIQGPTSVVATCQTRGAIEALPNTITGIFTPTRGWIAVTNPSSATVGAPVETDAKLRDRQSLSVAIPSQAMLDGTIGGIASVLGVKRYKVYDNDTGQTDSNGIPSHSISAVVEGGLDADIAKQIYLRKGPGGGTYGDVITSYKGDDGQVNMVRFFRPTYVMADVNITVLKKAGYTSDTKNSIISKVGDYISSLDIGNPVTSVGAMAAVLSSITNLSNPPFSISALTIGIQGGTMGIVDIPISFKEVAKQGDILITEV